MNRTGTFVGVFDESWFSEETSQEHNNSKLQILDANVQQC